MQVIQKRTWEQEFKGKRRVKQEGKLEGKQEGKQGESGQGREKGTWMEVERKVGRNGGEAVRDVGEKAGKIICIGY